MAVLRLKTWKRGPARLVRESFAKPGGQAPSDPMGLTRQTIGQSEACAHVHKSETTRELPKAMVNQGQRRRFMMLDRTGAGWRRREQDPGQGEPVTGLAAGYGRPSEKPHRRFLFAACIAMIACLAFAWFGPAAGESSSAGSLPISSNLSNRLRSAAAAPGLQGWKRDFMLRMAQDGHPPASSPDETPGILNRPLGGPNPEDGDWSQATPSGSTPGARTGHTAVYDPLKNRMIVFGGTDAHGNRYNDTWTLSLEGIPAWSQLAPAGILPAPRASRQPRGRSTTMPGHSRSPTRRPGRSSRRPGIRRQRGRTATRSMTPSATAW